MTMRLEAIAGLFPDVEVVEITSWVERGWVLPDAGDDAWAFGEIDIARVRLIRDLRREMGVAEEQMTLVLSLLDQVYDLRGTLKAVTRAVQRQPADVRAALLAALREAADPAP